MRLSTSNFNVKRMVAAEKGNFVSRSLLIALLAIVLYQVMISSNVISPSEGINLQQMNNIKMQRYAYEKSDIDMALVGSSITAKIRSEYIGDKVYNIALRGGSTQTGLEIVRQKKAKPKVLLVELNDTISRPVDQELIGSLYNPFLYMLRANFSMFKQEYRPVGVFLYNLTRLVGWKRESREQNILNSPLRKMLLQRQKEKLTLGLSPEQKELITEQANIIKEQLEGIGSYQTRVVLFNPPGESSLEETLQKREMQLLLEDWFPSDRFEWLVNPEKDWTTTDGVHLTINDAKVYGAYLRSQLLDGVSG